MMTPSWPGWSSSFFIVTETLSLAPLERISNSFSHFLSPYFLFVRHKLTGSPLKIDASRERKRPLKSLKGHQQARIHTRAQVSLINREAEKDSQKKKEADWPPTYIGRSAVGETGISRFLFNDAGMPKISF